MRRRDRGSWTSTAAALRGPLYAVAGAGQPYQGGFGYSGRGSDRVVNASVRHVQDGVEVNVQTSDEDWPLEADDWLLASDWVHLAVRPQEVRFPLRLEADRWEQQVAVDGRLWPFVLVGNAQAWCASGRVEGRRVSVAARGLPPEDLVLVAVRPSGVSEEVPDAPG